VTRAHFVGLTLQWVDRDWVCHNVVHGVRHVKQQDAEYVRSHIQKELDRDLPRAVLGAAVLDGASAAQKAGALLVGTRDTVHCALHRLNLAVKTGTLASSEFWSGVEAIKAVVTETQSSSIMASALTEMQKARGMSPYVACYAAHHALTLNRRLAVVLDVRSKFCSMHVLTHHDNRVIGRDSLGLDAGHACPVFRRSNQSGSG